VVQNAAGTDYCAGPNPQASLAACELSGLKASQYGSQILQCPAGQCSTQVSGNLGLKPELGDTWTWGIVMTPTELPNFTASVDYWDISISNYIQDLGIPISDTLNQCLIYMVTSACGAIHRAPGSGIVYGTAGYVAAPNLNVNNVHTSGLDFAASYKQDLAALGAPGMGSVKADFTGTATMDYTVSLFKNGISYNCAGLYGPSCGGSTGGPDPYWRHKMRVTWSTPWDADLSLAWRHIGSVGLDANQSNPLIGAGKANVDYVDGRLSAADYFDLAATWQVNSVIELRGGVNNIFDRDPPTSNYALGTGVVTNNNNVYTNYDTLGRTLYMGVNAKF
jgi:outer membrane receptor protein involved in Fe transport